MAIGMYNIPECGTALYRCKTMAEDIENVDVCHRTCEPVVMEAILAWGTSTALMRARTWFTFFTDRVLIEFCFAHLKNIRTQVMPYDVNFIGVEATYQVTLPIQPEIPVGYNEPVYFGVIPFVPSHPYVRRFERCNLED